MEDVEFHYYAVQFGVIELEPYFLHGMSALQTTKSSGRTFIAI